MKLTMVARDLAPSRAFGLIEKELAARGVEIASYLGCGKPLSGTLEQIREDVKGSSLVLLGFSSSPELSKEEIFAAQEAVSAGAPYGFYSDIYGAANRPWFEPLREKTRFVFMMSQKDADQARLIFPNADIVVSGNPILENAFFPPHSYGQMRSSLGIAKDELLIVCPGGKNMIANILHFGGVVEAVARFEDRRRWKIFFLLHPGDPQKPDDYADLEIVEGVAARIVPASEIAAIDAIVACDIMVSCFSTAGIEAACQRKPVIDYVSKVNLARLKKQTGADRWHPCEQGASREVSGNPIELSEALIDLLFGDDFRRMRARQEACYPIPAHRGAGVKIMTETLLKLSTELKNSD